MATVILSRNGPRGIACVAVLVDMGCLGIRRCFAADDLDSEEYERIVSTMDGDGMLLAAEPAFALKLVQAGLAWAAGLGFRQEPDWVQARELFAGIDPSDCDEEILCGRAGRPVFVSGPDDDVDAIRDRLDERVGPDGYDYVTEVLAPRETSLATDDWEHVDDEELARETGIDLQTARSWRRVRQAEARVRRALIEWTSRRFEGEMRVTAMFELLLWNEDLVEVLFRPEEAADADDSWEADPIAARLVSALETMFEAWFFFTFLCEDDQDDQDEQHDWPEGPLALAWLAEHERVDALDRRLVALACSEPFSFYVVGDVQPGRGMHLRCVFSGREYDVLDRLASQSVRRGGLLLARVVSLESVAVVCGSAAEVLPPSCLPAVVRFREEQLGWGAPMLDEEQLRECDLELRELYLDLLQALADPPERVLQNTDGEPLQLTTLVYELACSPREAFDALIGLMTGIDDDPLDAAEYDDAGELVRVGFPWSKAGNAQNASWSNTILGQLTIDRLRLEVEVNSRERLQRIRDEIAARLGPRAVCVSAESRAIDELLGSAQRSGSAASEPATGKSCRSRRQDPAKQEVARAMAAAHWAAWIDEQIPVLGGVTPREAAKTARGRELLESLLCDFEWSNAAAPGSLIEPDVDALRRELGL